MFELTDKVAVVTGASRGIGRTIAMRLASQGAVVCAAARGDNARETAGAITAAGGRADAYALDVTDGAAVTAFFEAVTAQHGRVDVLVNNAGITRDQLMLRMKRQDWDAVLDTNLTGAFLMAQLAARSMAAAGGGAIVHNASIDASGGDGPFAAYNASKAALLGLNRTMALELAEHGIRSNCVSPGFTHTEMTEKAVGPEMMSYLNGQFARVPMKRLVRTDEVANAILFLSSEDASAITGIDLRVDCGLTSNWFILETLPEH